MDDFDEIRFRLRDDEPGVSLHSDGHEWACAAAPFQLCFPDGTTVPGRYSSTDRGPDGWVAVATVSGPDGTEVRVNDRWRFVAHATVQVDRTVEMMRRGDSPGIRVEFRPETTFGEPRTARDFQFFIPGSLYNRNDTDHDGIEDYLGTYVQDYRDDRLASLAVLAYLPSARRYVALARVDKPSFDDRLVDAQLVRRHFVHRTDIGSLGLAPTEGRGDQVSLRASYPFSEENTFCLNVERDGWAAYLDMSEGDEASVSYRLSTAHAESLTDAIWDVTTRQMETLETTATPSGIGLEQSLEMRMMLFQHFYRRWTSQEDPREPAGFMVHFSPRSGEPNGTLLEYGFTGAQAFIAYLSIRLGHQRQVPLYVDRGRRVIDFYVEHCTLPNGFAHGTYDVARQEFVHWFTGILMPFQYSSTDEELRRYLGSQVTEALAPIAAQLRQVEGNYLRSMCESFFSILRAYKYEAGLGARHDPWLNASVRFGEFLLDTQAPDGSWMRAYSPQGEGLDTPTAWFGASDTERKSGTIFPVPTLLELLDLTSDPRYLDAAVQAARFIVDTYVDSVEYLGGLNDTTHIKGVKIDAVSVMFAMRSLLRVHEATGAPEFLDGAARAARILSSWVYLWDVPFPAESLLGQSGFRTTGWAGCDVIPAGSYLDNEFAEFVPDLVTIAGLTGDRELFAIAKVVQNGMQYGLSSPNDMLGYAMPGIQCEGIMTAYWMSDQDTTAFSGAINKGKGDDNDTCNGLVNAQAVMGILGLIDAHGTADLDQIRDQLFA